MRRLYVLRGDDLDPFGGGAMSEKNNNLIVGVTVHVVEDGVEKCECELTVEFTHFVGAQREALVTEMARRVEEALRKAVL